MARTIAKDFEAKRARILGTAAEVFAREGVARASMARVAQACGISKANIYHYHDSKDALLFDILDSYLSALRDCICDVPLEGLPPAAQLHALIEAVLLAYEGMDNEHKIQTEGIALLPLAQQTVLRGYQRDMVDRFSTVLRAAAPSRFEADKALLRATTMSVFGMLNWFYMWHPQADTQARKDYARLVTDLTMGGIKGL